MRLLQLALVLLYTFPLLANDDKYIASKINPALKKDAYAVYRLDEGNFEIQKIDKATYSTRQIITILNKKADNLAKVTVYYDKLINVKSISAVAYDAKGNELNKWKKKDFEDYSNISGVSLYEDNRVLYADLSQEDYPYTIEITYEKQYKYLYTIPDWYVLPAYHVSIEESNYTIRYPDDAVPKFKLKNSEKEPIKTTNKGTNSLSWNFKMLNAQKSEIFSRGIFELSPIIMLTPTKFSFEGYEGDMTNWDGFAKWQHSLNDGLNDLSSETVNEIKQLTNSLASDRDKVKAVYEYMQNRTRYVSVQLGIGGYQPFSANTVHEVGYGDCKGLTFYTQCLLKAAGIKSYYTWIYGGEEPAEIDPNFPSDKFNHIILFVPLEKDSIWLECTSQNLPAGFLGSFTSDRYALVLDKDKANLMRTPTFRDGTNKVDLKAILTLEESGNATIQVKSEHQGLGTEYYNIEYYASENHNNQEKWVRRFIPLSDMQINNFEFVEEKGDLPAVKFSSEVYARNVAKKVSDKYLLNPSILNYEYRRFKKDADRKTNIHFPYDYIMEYELNIILPEGYKVENQLVNESFENQFGLFKSEYIPTENGYTCKRNFRPNKGEYPADQIEELWKFFDEINKMESQRLMISKKS